MVVERQVADVEHERATRPFVIDNDGDGTSLDAFTESHAATAGEARVSKAFQHRGRIILQERLDLPLHLLQGDWPEVLLAHRSVARDEERHWNPDNRAVRLFNVVLHQQ